VNERDSQLPERVKEGGNRRNHPEGVQVQLSRLTKADGTIVCERCWLATSPLARARGLLGRSSLEAGEGMLFRPAGSIHMFFMRFAIDAIFCDSELVVLDVTRGLRPWRIAGARGAKVVIELGEGAASGVSAGDRLVLATIEA
jgi:uncharacterized membrane protein (UPF0127 family)